MQDTPSPSIRSTAQAFAKEPGDKNFSVWVSAVMLHAMHARELGDIRISTEDMRLDFLRMRRDMFYSLLLWKHKKNPAIDQVVMKNKQGITRVLLQKLPPEIKDRKGDYASMIRLQNLVFDITTRELKSPEARIGVPETTRPKSTPGIVGLATARLGCVIR